MSFYTTRSTQILDDWHGLRRTFGVDEGNRQLLRLCLCLLDALYDSQAWTDDEGEAAA